MEPITIKFQNLTAANEILKDEKKRREYDEKYYSDATGYPPVGLDKLCESGDKLLVKVESKENSKKAVAVLSDFAIVEVDVCQYPIAVRLSLKESKGPLKAGTTLMAPVRCIRHDTKHNCYVLGLRPATDDFNASGNLISTPKARKRSAGLMSQSRQGVDT